MKNNTNVRLPADLPLERDLIAGCIARPESVLTCGISEDDFAIDSHRIIWRAMNDLLELGQSIDLVNLRSRLTDSDNLDSIGGEEFLAGFRSVAPIKTALPIDRLKELTRKRALRAMAERVAAAAAGNDPDLTSVALDSLQALSDGGNQPIRPKTMKELASEWYEGLTTDPDANTVSPGLAPLKRILHRIDCGSMTLIGADTNVGKSTAALEMLVLAMLDGERVGYLSMEDPEKVVTQRLMSCVADVSPKFVRRFRPGMEGEQKIDRAMNIMHQIDDRVLVSGCIGMNERQVLEQMTMMAKRGAKLIVLDYIGVVGSSVKQQDRRNEIRWIATRFKARASHQNVALVVVSQFSRPRDGDPSRKPTKHSFKEAGDLESMAEYAILMWRTVEDDFAPVYFELAKSKTGGLGHGWTMQREIEKRDGSPGSGRLVEVAHNDDDIRDEHNNRVEVRPVMADRSGGERWSVQKSSR